jgi:hypothetical protein
VFSLDFINDEKRINFYVGKVTTLGTIGIASIASSSLSKADFIPSIENALVTGGVSPRIEVPLILTDARRAVQTNVSKVIVEAKHRDDYSFFKKIANLPVFLGGGGSRSAWYETAIMRTHGDNQHGNLGIPQYDIRQIPFPTDLIVDESKRSEFYRYSIAYGLSLPDGEGPSIQGFPRQNPRIPSPKTKAIDLESIQREIYGEA